MRGTQQRLAGRPGEEDGQGQARCVENPGDGGQPGAGRQVLEQPPEVHGQQGDPGQEGAIDEVDPRSQQEGEEDSADSQDDRQEEDAGEEVAVQARVRRQDSGVPDAALLTIGEGGLRRGGPQGEVLGWIAPREVADLPGGGGQVSPQDAAERFSRLSQ